MVPALLAFQAPLGFVAILGVIALGGMIMRNSVILVDQVQTEMAEGRDPWNAVLDAAIHRTRPVVLTALATVLAMVPLTRSVFWGPMAIAIMGGLTVATVLTIFFVPAPLLAALILSACSQGLVASWKGTQCRAVPDEWGESGGSGDGRG